MLQKFEGVMGSKFLNNMREEAWETVKKGKDNLVPVFYLQ